MNRLIRLALGVALGAGMLCPSRAAAQRCPACMQMWYQVQMQQQAMYRSALSSYRNSLRSWNSYRPNYRPSFAAGSARLNAGWRNSLERRTSTDYRRPSDVERYRTRSYQTSRELYQTRLTTRVLERRLPEERVRVPRGPGRGPAVVDRSRRETTRRSLLAYLETMRLRQGQTRRPSERDRTTIPGQALNRAELVRVRRPTAAMRPEPPRRAWAAGRDLLAKKAAAREDALTSPRLMVQNRTQVQLRVRVDFTCGRCHLSAPQRPPASLVSLLPAPRLPISPLGAPADPGLTVSPLARPRLPKLPPSELFLAKLPVPTPSATADRLPLSQLVKRDLPAPGSDVSADENPHAGPLHSTSEPADPPAARVESPAQPPPLPPLPRADFFSQVDLPPEPEEPSPEPAAVRQFVSRPPPLPPLPLPAS